MLRVYASVFLVLGPVGFVPESLSGPRHNCCTAVHTGMIELRCISLMSTSMHIIYIYIYVCICVQCTSYISRLDVHTCNRLLTTT